MEQIDAIRRMDLHGHATEFGWWRFDTVNAADARRAKAARLLATYWRGLSTTSRGTQRTLIHTYIYYMYTHIVCIRTLSE